jgi:TrmH RNA methyltransferase
MKSRPRPHPPHRDPRREPPVHRPRPHASPESPPSLARLARARTPARTGEFRAPGAQGETILGLRAGLAVFDRRKEEIVRVAYAGAVARDVEALARWAESRRLPCDEVPEHELHRIAGSDLHEGLCVLARERRWASSADLADLLVRTRGTAIALDRVRNPYNVGAILRSAAFFGVGAVLLGTPAPHPGLPPLAVRVAEGGAEHVVLARTTDLADTLSRLKTKGVRVVGTDGHAQDSVLGFAFRRPTILVLGNEREGLLDRVRAQCDAVVRIPGTGAVESLNVGVAAGVMMAELTRRKT